MAQRAMAFRGTLRQVFEGLLFFNDSAICKDAVECITSYVTISEHNMYIYIYYDYNIILYIYIYLDFWFFSVSTLLERPKRNTLASSSWVGQAAKIRPNKNVTCNIEQDKYG